MQLSNLLGKNSRIVVCGDIMLDRYTWGIVERVSPEAPIPLIRADTEEARLGGAASAAMLLKGLDADVQLAGVVGDDASGRVVRRLLDEQLISQEAVITDPSRQTTTKQRFIGRSPSRHPHQLLRVDHEDRSPLSAALAEQLTEAVLGQLGNAQALLISDYNKGTCPESVLQDIIAAARRATIPVIVDPARIEDFARYRGATILIPNRVEAELATGIHIDSIEQAKQAADILRQRLNLQAVILKIDRDGMVLAVDGQPARHFSTKHREVCDITGAGDMVLAVIGLAIVAGASLHEAVRLANVAAGLEVERVGVATVSRHDIQTQLEGDGLTHVQKHVSREELAQRAQQYRHDGTKVVFTNGCFDLLHVGHVKYLQQAASLGDVLIVALNSDQSVRRLKGPARPVVNESDRASIIAALGCVDHVLIFDEATPHELLRGIRPDVLVKGGDYTIEEVVGREIVQQYGGQICVTALVEGRSTSETIESLRTS